MSRVWNGDVTFVSHDTTDDGFFQVTAFADSVANQDPFTDFGDVTEYYTSRANSIALPPLDSNEVHALIITFSGESVEDPLTEEYPAYQPSAQSDSGSPSTGYHFHADTVFVVMGMNGLNQDNLALSFKAPTVENEASVRARWVGITLTFP